MNRYYHGSRTAFHCGDMVEPTFSNHQDSVSGFVYLTPILDEAIWSSEIADGESSGRVYIVEPTGAVTEAATLPGHKPLPHPSMSCLSPAPLRVVGEVTEWPLYHGTRADLQPGDLITPGKTPNFGRKDRTTRYVYVSRTLDAAKWGAELAAGSGRERIYRVKPTGVMEDDPNLTDQKFRGNPTKSFRSRDPFKILEEVRDWVGHSPEAIKAMKAGIAALEQRGVEPLDD